MIILIIIMIIALKGAKRDFLQTPHCDAPLSPAHTPGCDRVQITCTTSSVYHVQDVYQGQLSCLTEFKSHFTFILLAESFTDEGGEETGV